MEIAYPVDRPRPIKITAKRQHKERKARRHLSPALLVGIVVVSMIAIFAIFAEALAPYDIAQMNPAERLQGPSANHLFGTDLFGRDLFSRVIMGSRLSLSVALFAVAIGALPGILLGMLAGMYNGLFASICSYLMDAWMAVPGLLLAIALAAAFGRSTSVLAIALGLASIPVYYRQTRAETLRTSSCLYIEAAHSIGCKERHILMRHVLPNIAPTVIVLVTLRIGGMLMAVSAFSFVGLGAQPPTPEWGALLADGREYMQNAWWLTFFPGCALAITIFGLNMLGDGLRDLLDPSMQP